MDLSYHLALWRMPGIGPATFEEWINTYDDLKAVFHAKGKDLHKAHATAKTLQYLQKPDWQGVERDLAWTQKEACRIVCLPDPEYPNLLKEISRPPPILFVQGSVQLLSKPQIAMVGSRNPTAAGIELAFAYAKHFSECRFGVTSGLALGIDAASHQGALEGEGGTIAVLGCGLDHIYPAFHKELAINITKNGALVSEFPIGVFPKNSHFPRRNRLISGLSLGTLVVEAAVKSGSLITAKYALEQGREVFAIPGSIHNPLVKGCHALIQQGAKLVERAEDVLEELSNWFPDPVSQGPFLAGRAQEPLMPLDKPLRELLDYVGYEGTSIDQLVSNTGQLAGKVASQLMQLELHGYVVSVPGGYARKVLAAKALKE